MSGSQRALLFLSLDDPMSQVCSSQRPALYFHKTYLIICSEFSFWKAIYFQIEYFWGKTCKNPLKSNVRDFSLRYLSPYAKARSTTGYFTNSFVRLRYSEARRTSNLRKKKRTASDRGGKMLVKTTLVERRREIWKGEISER